MAIFIENRTQGMIRYNTGDASGFAMFGHTKIDDSTSYVRWALTTDYGFLNDNNTFNAHLEDGDTLAVLVDIEKGND